MSDFLVRLVEMIMKISEGRSDGPSTSILGSDYEQREARRSAIWVFCILAVLFLLGWWFLHWIKTS